MKEVDIPGSSKSYVLKIPVPEELIPETVEGMISRDADV